MFSHDMPPSVLNLFPILITDKPALLLQVLKKYSCDKAIGFDIMSALGDAAVMQFEEKLKGNIKNEEIFGKSFIFHHSVCNDSFLDVHP